MGNIVVSIELEQKRFASHLKIEGNERIIFSGRFGIGKTYFLEKFFESNREEYELIHLFPVNYSIAQNEDILSYIKYDILSQLLDKDLIDLEKDESYSRSLYIQSYILNKGGNFISELLSSLPKIGAPVKILKPIVQFVKKFEDYKNDIKDAKIKPIQEFAEDVERKACWHSFDVVDELICESLANEKLKDKKKVLVIDDLDRIDPEHIFRILNVFAAHFDQRESGNKFGFDAVIVVCDVDNIRSIFSHYYGISTDFNGYIDKFYSKETFCYSNVWALAKKSRESYYVTKIPRYEILWRGENDMPNNCIEECIVKMIYADAINMRAFLKTQYPNYYFLEGARIHHKQDNIFRIGLRNILFTIIKILTYALGSEQALLEAIDKCIKMYPEIRLNNGYLAGLVHHDVIEILDKYNGQQGNNLMYCDKSLDIIINYSNSDNGSYAFAIKHNGSNESMYNIPFFQLMKQAALRIFQDFEPAL